MAPTYPGWRVHASRAGARGEVHREHARITVANHARYGAESRDAQSMRSVNTVGSPRATPTNCSPSGVTSNPRTSRPNAAPETARRGAERVGAEPSWTLTAMIEPSNAR